MRLPRPAKGALLVAQAVLLLAISSFFGAEAETQSIFYVTGEDTPYELRVYHPLKGTRTVLKLLGEPSDIYWTQDFKTITFRVGDEVFESDWRIGSEARRAITLPTVSGDNYRESTAWYDTDSQAWRYCEIQYPADDAKERKYFARVFQYDQATREWKKLVDQETYGCEQGDGSACGAEVHQYTKGQSRHVLQTQLSEEMRLGSLMDELGIEYEESLEHKDFWFEFGGSEVSVLPVFGDSLHAMAPVKWRDGSEPMTIFPAELEYPCMNQVGLKRIGRFLLVATEWYGRCGRVIELETGETVHELPAKASKAVVVPWPEGE